MGLESKIGGLKIRYEVFGKGTDIVVLHGWGACIETVLPVVRALEQNFRVWAVDLPGFGKSEVPPADWDVYRYADFVEMFIKELSIHNPVVIGHSNGGRLGIILAAQQRADIKKLVLVDSAGVKPKHGPSYHIRVYTYKAAKKLARLAGKLSSELEDKIKGKFGSEDYKNANPVMRGIMVRIVNEDLTGLFPAVKQPVLLIWGDKDEATPISDARLMEDKMPDAGLVVFEGAGHYSYLEQPAKFRIVVNKFLETEMERG